MNSENMLKMTLPSGEQVLTDAKIRIGPSPIAGTGVFAIRKIRKDELIGEYTGEIISSDEADERHGNGEDFYTFLLDSGECIDPTNDETNLVKYINHSCEPNCEAEEDEADHIHIRAIKDIEPGEELCYDYHVESDDDDEVTCRCGTASCKGTMRGEETDDVEESEDDEEEDE